MIPLDIEVGCIKMTELGRERGFVSLEWEHDDGNRYTIMLSKTDVRSLEILLTPPKEK